MTLHPGLVISGPTSPDEILPFIMLLQRRPNGQARVERDDFVREHGVDPDALRDARSFLQIHQLKEVGFDPRSKMLQVSGAVKDINAAFGIVVEEGTWKGRVIHRYQQMPTLPVGVLALLGLELPPVAMRNFAVHPPNTNATTVKQLRQLYNFPPNSAAGQTIGIFEASDLSNQNPDDLTAYFQLTGDTVPQIVNVIPQDGTVNGGEANLDICIAASAAPGATIAMYYASQFLTTIDQFLFPVVRMIHPWAGDPNCSVISISYSFADNSNATDFCTPPFHAAMTSLFQDAQALGITVLASSGDQGSGYKLGATTDGQAYVQMPSTHPLVLSCGGTVVGNINGTQFEEYIWNDKSTGGGATGGGVSRNYPVPSYQATINPINVSSLLAGRGTPDITGEAAPASGVVIFVDGFKEQSGGTSLTVPLYAGLIAIINAALGRNVGFIHSILYNPANSSVFRDITNATLGPPDNASFNAPGYPAKIGWDGSSGLGSVDGIKLLNVLRPIYAARPVFSYRDDDSLTTFPIPNVSDSTFGFTHPALSAGNHTVRILKNGSEVTSVRFAVQLGVSPGLVQILTVTPEVGSLIVTWMPPTTGNPPFTYKVDWGTSSTSFPNSKVVATSPFTIQSLSGGPWFVQVAATGANGLVGSPTVVGPTALIVPQAVTKMQNYLAIADNTITSVQWDNVPGATGYHIDYATSPSGPWFTSPEGPYPDGQDNTDSLNLPATSGVLTTLESLNTGPVNLTTGFTAGRNYWTRIRALFSDGTITTSAPYGQAVFVAAGVVGQLSIASRYPRVTHGECQSLSPGHIDVQWDDILPAVSPQDNVTPLSYLLVVSQCDSTGAIITGGRILTFGPFSTGFGCNRKSSNGSLAGQFLTVTGIPPGMYVVQTHLQPAFGPGLPGVSHEYGGNGFGTSAPFVIVS